MVGPGGSADKASKVKSLLASYYDTEDAPDSNSLHDTPRRACGAAPLLLPTAASWKPSADNALHLCPLPAAPPRMQVGALACGAPAGAAAGQCRLCGPQRHIL